jgi:hypothetical protein
VKQKRHAGGLAAMFLEPVADPHSIHMGFETPNAARRT